jgi:hypothetical protein
MCPGRVFGAQEGGAVLLWAVAILGCQRHVQTFPMWLRVWHFSFFGSRVVGIGVGAKERGVVVVWSDSLTRVYEMRV